MARSGCLNPYPRNSSRVNLPLQLHQVATQAVGDLHAQFSELEELLSKLVLPPEEEDGCERRSDSDGEQREHYRHGVHYWHSPVCT